MPETQPETSPADNTIASGSSSNPISSATLSTEHPITSSANGPEQSQSSGPSDGQTNVDHVTASKCLELIKSFESGTRDKMCTWFGIQNTIVAALAVKASEPRTAKGSKTSTGKKRARSTSSSDGSGHSGDIGTDDDDGDENALTRGKVDKRLLAWLWHEEPDSFTSKSVLEKNRLTFANCQQDPSLVKASAGKPIDFDAVITSTHTLDYDQKQSIKLGSGSAEIRFRSRAPVKKYLTGLFKAYEPSQHPNVINSDKVVRQRVSNRRDLLLSDTSEFQDLYITWITNTITSSNVTSPSSPPAKRRYRVADGDI
ncbi:hypothetical protein K435DRAFT_873586 [Dendrothele bispora CBS 962.96]|uniref:Uncharacterized protein n=1 Tax=Dendrothele bispora (strain CBS 962.96) TaxID=1314807 RepID=A0A4S8KZ05_DENBC|nr:hypothetical protein K435DRAFT_873586 [Dendrothele bispora CBS 962.96]